MTEAGSRSLANLDLSDRRDGDTAVEARDRSAIEDEDYRDLVTTARQIAVVGLVSKAIASVLFARFHGATLELRRLFGWFPYLGIRATRPVFADVVTSASVVMTAAVIVTFVVLIRRPADLRTRRLRSLGAFVGPLIVALTLALECIRHLRYPPVLDLRWVAVCLVAVGMAAAVGVVTFPRDRRHPEPHEDGGRPGDLVAAT